MNRPLSARAAAALAVLLLFPALAAAQELRWGTDPTGGAPFVPPAFRPVVQAACAVLQQHQARVASAAGARIAAIGDVIGTAFADDPTLFSRDRFHPSSEGYARIADALAPHVVEAAIRRRDETAA